MAPILRHTPTKSQQKHLSYLAMEKKRQKGSLEEHSQYPEFFLECSGCFSTLKTANPEAGRSFIMTHAGHKAFVMEIHHHPNSPTFDKKQTLAELMDLGLYLVAQMGDKNSIVKEARNTYRFISNGGDTQGGLERLLSFMIHQKVAHFYQFWVRSILRRDMKFIERAKRLTNEKKGE